MHLTASDREEILRSDNYLRAKDRLKREPLAGDLIDEWLLQRELKKIKTLKAKHDLTIHSPFPGEKSHTGERQ